MTSCIKTGARVYLVEYDVVLPADVFEVGPDVLVFIFNMALFHDRGAVIPRKDVTHSIKLGSQENSFFWDKNRGILVIHDGLVITL